MLDGESIKDTFYILRTEKAVLLPTLPKPKVIGCCGACVHKVLADTTTDDDLKNDKNRFLWWFADDVNEASLTLLKYDHAVGDFTDLVAIDDSTVLGDFYGLGFFINDAKEYFIGCQLNWKQVLMIEGEGSYKVRVDYTGFVGARSKLSDEFCLHQYTPERADGTVRIEYRLNGILGVNEDDTKIRDYGLLNWYNQLRLKGVFSYVKSQYEDDYTRYNNGSRPWVKEEQEPQYNLLLKPMCWNFHELMRTDVLQADEIFITDYNADLFHNEVKKSVQKTSEYAPNFFLKRSILASITNLTFRQATNNLKKRRC